MKKFLAFFMTVAIAVIACCSVNGTVVKANEYFYETEEDLVVIPDKYSTGVYDVNSLMPGKSGEYGQVKLYYSGSSDIKFDFSKYSDISGVVYISNYDFSERNVRVYNAGALNNQVTIVFENCNFSSFRGTTGSGGNVNFVFDRCSFNYCAGSNLTLNDCYFGGGYKDGLIPYSNVYVNNCYFADKSQQNTNKGVGAHTDGTQIYGIEGAEYNGNVHYFNCRFELPQLLNSTAYMNACIMLQIEFCDTDNVTFDHCYVNGGGYSIYARTIRGWKLTNSSLTNIKVGCAARYGTYCPCPSDTLITDAGIEFSNIDDADRLYVGSVWRGEDGQAHISVSNDTNDVRTLLVVTNNGEQQFTIPACYTYRQLTESVKFTDYPFDLDIKVGNANWVVCYDITNGYQRQIRFVDFAGNGAVSDDLFEVTGPVYDYTDDVVADDYTGDIATNNYVTDDYTADVIVTDDSFDGVVATGICGDAATWTYYSNGLLTIDGFGATYDYHSKNRPGWWDYRNEIKEVVISEGITRLGNYLFRECVSMEYVGIPSTVTALGNNTLSKCTSLKEIVLPAGLTKISSWCFNSTKLTSVVFLGSAEELDALVIGENNGKVVSLLGK